MNVIVDTSVWSLALRRNTPDDRTSIINVLRELIADGRVVLLGAIRQEVLSGIRYTEQFVKLRDYLRAFPDLEITTKDYELAAEFFNTCRRHGIQGSNTDFLICAVAHHRGYSLFTTDKDFENFRSHIPVVLL
ncbi:type II toxin-antitoxin system VapC family toxin [Coleofasciculus sp. G2-EDA-02]|uniref:type II toxin-antitoxin system VapC family toxin n=1 Tax=Coleofasciculus sp. G2-EDA-02 TaxID=3069529 RepID=UPI0032FF4A32